MAIENWTKVDAYIGEQLIGRDAVMDAVLAESSGAGLPPIGVSAPQGKLLHLIAKMLGAGRILELGTLGGYSTIWLARSLASGGKVITVEYESKHAGVALQNFARAGLADKIELRQGKAIDVLKELHASRVEPFDLVFIDADKPSAPDYFRGALKLTRPGGVIIIDNVVREGKVIEANSTDASIRGIRKMNELIAAEPRVSATALQTVGSKGYDGFALLLVNY